MKTVRRYIIAAILSLGLSPSALAQTEAESLQPALESGLPDTYMPQPRVKEYTKESPLVYEGSWDLWPYTFLNDQGEPDGYSVDLVRLIMKKLDIPYVIRLKPTAQAFNDLKEGRSDLMLGIAAGFHDEYGLYGETALTLFTQSVVTPKSKPVKIHTFKDLATERVIVNDGSLCHHLMQDYGWESNAIPSRDLKETLLEMSANEEGQVVWNTLSLKWLLRRYQLDNLRLTPVNMPHGEYKFMSNDSVLLDRLDSIYAVLNSAEQITPILNKWFYPDRQEETASPWLWYIAAGVALLTLFLIVYTVIFRVQGRRITEENNRRNRRLALILETSQVHLWTYDVEAEQFTWRNDNGQPAYTYSPEEFSQRYASEDYHRLRNCILRLAEAPKPGHGEDEEEVKLNIKAKDTESGSDEMRDYVIALSVLSRNKQGRATVIIGTKKDVTDSLSQKRQADERALRYQAIFNTSIVGIMLFDKHGLLKNINQKACQMYQCDHDEILAERVSLYDILDIDGIDLHDLDHTHATQVVDIDKIPDAERTVIACKRTGKLAIEFHLMTVKDENGDLLGIFAICSDVSTARANLYAKEAELREMEALKKTQAEFDRNIDIVLHQSDVRLVSYSPSTHVLSIYRSANEVQHALTQTRCMTLVDDHSKKLAMRLLADMDSTQDKEITAEICTALRVKGLTLCLLFHLTPLHDAKGNITQYLGLCRDSSESRYLRMAISRKEAQVEELEQAKTSFMKNMVKEIQTPMNSVTTLAAALSPSAPTPNEEALEQGILNNADALLHLIENILLLSRLEAHMHESPSQPVDFARLFDAYCSRGWAKLQNEKTRYVIENPYNALVVDINAEQLGLAITQLTANAAKHTRNGSIRTRYDYIGRRLIISVDDTGTGMSRQQLEAINQQMEGRLKNTKGLGLAICNEIVRQLKGTMEINSEEGLGTTVYITIPCHATVVRRKKIV